MKRVLLAVFCVFAAACLLTACAPKAAPSEREEAFGRAENEILTYDPIDPAKTQIVLSVTGNIYPQGLIEAFEEKHPDVQVILQDISGGNNSITPVADWVRNGQVPDVMILMPGSFSAEDTVRYFEDMSAKPWIVNYQSAALNAVAVDSHAYWLPGPSQLDCMVYNKTLFDQYGWQVPKTFDQFVDLCLQIREDTGGQVQPWNPNAKYSNEFEKATEAFVYRELFGGVENRAWYEDFCRGKATFAGHMEPYYQMLQTLIDNHILLEEHFTYSATTRGKEFAAGKIAMYNYVVAPYDNDQYTYAFMPFPTTLGTEGYLCDNVTFLLGVPKKERTDRQRDAMDRLIAFFSTPEGQRAYIGQSMMFSNVKSVETVAGEALKPLRQATDEGRVFNQLLFNSETAKAAFSFRTDALDMLTGTRTGAQCIADADVHPFVTEEAEAPAAAIAVATEPFTVLETSFYIADMYREVTGADIALINNNVAYRGNLMRIFPGELTLGHVNTLLPRSLANDSRLVKVRMTGAELMAALNTPRGNDETTNSIYAYSGLKCTVAPANKPGEKYLSVTLDNGSQITPEMLYFVAFWEGTVYNNLYQSDQVEAFEGSFEELLAAKLKSDGRIAPAKDGRITLVWEE